MIQEKYSFPQKDLPIDVLDTFKVTTSITHLLFQRNCRSDPKKKEFLLAILIYFQAEKLIEVRKN